jgi:hypothetical protein
MPLEFTIRVELDEHRVIDGRALARRLIGYAYCLIVFDFPRITNHIIEDI